ncbi:MAG: bifunctional DNA-formamidopyrimidine glycosylase/DNA-(apurinic or apyrimidinic site) lyase [Acidobacteria bacterium]|nr:bifunctional DNA-formamidopyrimidine glycosylase/DNA-(apurinic or apyrimidinic site) lyase [Acidobacteriota bacterium]
MPELPEVETVRRSLLPHLEGRRVVGVEARRVRLRQGIEPDEWRAFEGVVVRTILRRGKYLAVTGDEVSAVLHLGMSGRLAVADPRQPHAAHTHLVVHLDSGRELRFVDPRRFGSAVVRPTRTLPLVPPLASLGAEPLDDAAGGVLRDAAGRTRVAIRNLLLDQTVLAGVGNIYANEALARAGIHPGRPANRLSRRRLDRLAWAVRETLEDAIAAGGTTLEDGGFADATGEAGYFAVDLAVYGRDDAPCRGCGRAIRRFVLTGRSAYFCPHCQR